MIAAFFHARQPDTYANMAVRALKRVMDCRVLHLTDEDTPGLAGCDVIRLPWDGEDPMVFRALHLAQLEGEVLSLDTDIVVQRDLSKVFDWPFDVALTKRDGPILTPNGFDVTTRMPYNGGVVFSRSPDFWPTVHAWSAMNAKACGWMVDQVALAEVSKGVNVLILHCDNFNYTPTGPDDDVSRRFAVHYKGKRKEWMNGNINVL